MIGSHGRPGTASLAGWVGLRNISESGRIPGVSQPHPILDYGADSSASSTISMAPNA